MSEYVVSCTSSIDMNDEFINNHGLYYISYHFHIGKNEYDDDFGKSYPHDKFYRDVVKAKEYGTAAISSNEYYRYFKGLIEKTDKDVLHIEMTSGISGSCSNAMMAARDINEQGKHRVVVMDSHNASGGYALMTRRAALNRDLGYSIEDNVADLEEYFKTMDNYFYVNGLEMLVKGGRLPSFLGNLKIYPVLKVDHILKVVKKCLNKTKAQVELLKGFDIPADEDAEVIIIHSNCLEDALEFEQVLLRKYSNIKSVDVSQAGPVIGCHIGPGTVSLFAGKMK